LESIVADFGCLPKGKTKHDRINGLNEFLLQSLSRGENAVLIIDEAQNLSVPVLEQIRMLSNLETEKEKMLQIILFGQLELDHKLRSKELKQLNQRIAIRHHIQSLTQTETESYVHQRLMVAGSQGNITFSKSALNEIYKFSKGTPRLINLLCDRALLGGFVEQTYHINRGIIKKAKDSLLGDEKSPKLSYFFSLPKSFSPLRIAFLSVFVFLTAGMILTSQGYFPSFRNAKTFILGRIQDIYFQISGTTAPSVSAIPLNKESIQDSTQNEPAKNSDGASREVSK
jgi:general secretion pathway protein A